MSTMKKRIPMFLLALAMMVAMAVPAFAAPSYTVSPDPSGSSSSNYMNLHGNSSSVAGRYITLYNPSAHGEKIGSDQIVHKIGVTFDGRSGVYLAFRGNTQYAINRHSTSARAFMYPYPEGAYDSVLSNPSAEGSVYLITGSHAGQYLGWESDSEFANVYFGRGCVDWLWGYMPGHDVDA